MLIAQRFEIIDFIFQPHGNQLQLLLAMRFKIIDFILQRHGGQSQLGQLQLVMFLLVYNPLYFIEVMLFIH